MVIVKIESGFADPNATTFGYARAAIDWGAEFRLDTRVLRVLADRAALSPHLLHPACRVSRRIGSGFGD